MGFLELFKSDPTALDIVTENKYLSDLYDKNDMFRKYIDMFSLMKPATATGAIVALAGACKEMEREVNYLSQRLKLLNDRIKGVNDDVK